ncbi:MAG: hypothetical protein E4H16_05485, partial [Candidatus Atribacteria bacterium]
MKSLNVTTAYEGELSVAVKSGKHTDVINNEYLVFIKCFIPYLRIANRFDPEILFYFGDEAFRDLMGCQNEFDPALLLILFAILYIAGVNMFVCLFLIGGMGVILFMTV